MDFYLKKIIGCKFAERMMQLSERRKQLSLPILLLYLLVMTKLLRNTCYCLHKFLQYWFHKLQRTLCRIFNIFCSYCTKMSLLQLLQKHKKFYNFTFSWSSKNRLPSITYICEISLVFSSSFWKGSKEKILKCCSVIERRKKRLVFLYPFKLKCEIVRIVNKKTEEIITHPICCVSYHQKAKVLLNVGVSF